MADDPKGLTAAMGGLGEVVIAATGSLATLTVVLQQVQSQVQGFVAALSPAAITNLNNAILDLRATIGQAFLPAFIAFADVVRRIADQLDPVMRELAPLFQELAEVVGRRLIQVANATAVLIELLLPLWDALKETLIEFDDTMATVKIALGALFAATTVALLKGAFEALKPAIEQAIQAFQEAAKSLILIAASLAHAAGRDDFIDAMIRALTPREEQGHAVHAGPTQIEGLQQFAHQLALASAQAMGGAGEQAKTDNEYLRDVVQRLKEIHDDSSNILKRVERGYDATVKDASDWLNKAPLIHGVNELADGQIARGVLDLTPIGMGGDAINLFLRK